MKDPSSEHARLCEMTALKEELRDLREELSLLRQKQSDLTLKDVRLEIKDLYIEHLRELLREENRGTRSAGTVV